MSREVKVTIGDRCGRWVVLKFSRYDKWKNRHLECVCDCGTKRVVNGSTLRDGTSRSCGCLQREVAKYIGGIQHITHGCGSKKNRAPEYRAWDSMKARCYNEKTKNFRRYGGRGIKVCVRWRGSFENFLNDMGRKPSPNHSIDRINNDGNYEPGNCRWATKSQQMNNTCRSLKYAITR